MGGAIIQTRRFRSGPIDIEILRTAILLSAHQSRHHVGAADPLPVGVPVNIAVANAEGAAANFARRDHVHRHPSGINEHVLYRRLLRPVYDYSVYNDLTVATARVYLIPLEVPVTLTTDAIWVAYLDPSVGNCRAAIYADNGETPVGGALIVESASVAKGGIWSSQDITIADIELNPGLYWLAYQSDENTTIVYGHNTAMINNLRISSYRYDLGAYGAFTDPCPAVTVEHATPYLRLWVKSISAP